MSRIAKNLLKITLNNGFIGNTIQTTGRSLNQLRGISSVVTNGLAARHESNARKDLSVVSKRFAANSPQVDDELTQFLKNEIELEKKTQKNKGLPAIEGWDVKNDGSNVIFKRTMGSEEITVKANINHSVDTRDFGEEANTEAVSAEMVCRPDFAVEIKKGKTIMGINCAFVDPDEMEDDPQNPQEVDKRELEDEFQINELALYDEEFKENSYLVAGDVMDGSMYDHLMDLLDQRGIDQKFVRNLIEYTTAYEHNQYVGLLEKLKDFLAKK